MVLCGWGCVVGTFWYFLVLCGWFFIFDLNDFLINYYTSKGEFANLKAELYNGEIENENGILNNVHKFSLKDLKKE